MSTNQEPIFYTAGLLRCTGFVLATLVIVAGLGLWIFNPLALGRPSDRAMVALFRGHREAFEKLRDMAIEDSGSIASISEDSLKHSSLNEARRGEYMRLLAGIGRKVGIGIGPHQVTFNFCGGGVGLAIGPGWMQGITYLPDGYEKGGTIAKSLDDLGMRVPYGVYLVPIERNWYLIFSKLD